MDKKKEYALIGGISLVLIAIIALSLFASFQHSRQGAIYNPTNLSSIQGILPIAKGGTATNTPPTYGKMLIGNAAGGYTYIASSSLGSTPSGYNNVNWDIAYNWGNHASAGYVTQPYASSTFQQFNYPGYTSPATTTLPTSTTTLEVKPIVVAQTWYELWCFTNNGTSTVYFSDGTNNMNPLTVGTAVSSTTLTANNTFVAGEKLYINYGANTSSTTKVSCSPKIK